jgi:hypothetical protein
MDRRPIQQGRVCVKQMFMAHMYCNQPNLPKRKALGAPEADNSQTGPSEINVLDERHSQPRMLRSVTRLCRSDLHLYRCKLSVALEY